jgi:predicted nucleic acid-binding protein
MSSPSVGQVVLDSSAVVALLADRGTSGEWAAATVQGRRVAAPWLMPFEAGNSLRRRELAGDIDATASTLAHDELLSMRVDLWPHGRLADRAWDLRGAITYYDACYVALAELLDAPLVTLDRRLARAPGAKCAFLTPPEDG